MALVAETDPNKAQVSPFKLKELGENFLHICQFHKYILFTTDHTEYCLTKLHLILSHCHLNTVAQLKPTLRVEDFHYRM